MDTFMKNWLKSGKNVGLPDPDKEATPEKKLLTEAANAAVKQSSFLSPSSSDTKTKSKRGPYSHYSPELRAIIGRYAVEHGCSRKKLS